MSRSQEKLQMVADEISMKIYYGDEKEPLWCVKITYSFYMLCSENLYNRKVLIVPVDFTDGQPVYENIAKQLADLDIGILGIW